ncbi:MAG: hypothetical protein KJ587_17690 [Alphaproteobacteria bacterium]|nr:hypothetical protein [Alphaproteobacteria bacterium]
MLFARERAGGLAALAAGLSIGLLLAVAFGGASADAATVGNKDGIAYKLTIDEDGNRTTHELAAGAQLDGVCLKGCILILDGVSDGSYRLPEGNEIVTIEEGVLFYDGAAALKPEAQ